jgi:hypothetical protein
MEAAAELIAEENQIMFADLSIIDLEQRAWFKKKRAIIHERDT